MKRQLVNLTGKPIRFLTLPTLKPDTAPLYLDVTKYTPDYEINGIPVHTGAWVASRALPPLPPKCPYCVDMFSNCRECDGLGFDRNAPLYIVTEDVRITHANRRDFISVNETVNDEVISFRGPAR